MADAIQSTEILADRVRFDIIGERHGVEWRCWTDGGIVSWTVTRNGTVEDRGHIPAMLFRLAAHALADYCEDKAIEAGKDGDNFFNMVHDSLKTPVSLAMAHPYWDDQNDARNDLKFGFSSIAVNMAMDVQPKGLRSRGSGFSGGEPIWPASDGYHAEFSMSCGWVIVDPKGRESTLGYANEKQARDVAEKMTEAYQAGKAVRR